MWSPPVEAIIEPGVVQSFLDEKLMLAVYNEIQKKNSLLESEGEQADFLATQGVDKQKFLDAYDSDNVTRQARQADKLAFHDYQIEMLPTLVVAGRYKITPVNNGVDGIATVLDYLVKQVLDKKL